jgi:uncharacterized RDD family membrane protein YckC
MQHVNDGYDSLILLLSLSLVLLLPPPPLPLPLLLLCMFLAMHRMHRLQHAGHHQAAAVRVPRV